MDRTLIVLSALGGALIVCGVFLVGICVYAPANAPARVLSPSPLSERPVTLVFGGDVMLGRKVNYEMHGRNDFSFPFASITQVFASGDAAMVNFESPIVNGCRVSNAETMVLCADPLSASALKTAGVTVISFANNHRWDGGAAGIAQTDALLRGQGIDVVDQAATTTIAVRGKTIGFAAYNLTYGNVADADVVRAVSDLKKHADFVVVSLHWGEEYHAQPNAYQKRLGRAVIDAGADVVIGHHPHWVQPVESYKGKYIFYSLGNLVFDQMWSEQTRLGALVKLSVAADNTAAFEILPIKIFDWAQPRMLEGAEKQSVIGFMTHASTSAAL